MNVESGAEGVGQVLVGYKKVTGAREGMLKGCKRRLILAAMCNPSQPWPMAAKATSAISASPRVWS